MMKGNITIGILLLAVFVGAVLLFRCLLACCTMLVYKDSVRIYAMRHRDVEMQEPPDPPSPPGPPPPAPGPEPPALPAAVPAAA